MRHVRANKNAFRRSAFRGIHAMKSTRTKGARCLPDIGGALTRYHLHFPEPYILFVCVSTGRSEAITGLAGQTYAERRIAFVQLANSGATCSARCRAASQPVGRLSVPGIRRILPPHRGCWVGLFGCHDPESSISAFAVRRQYGTSSKCRPFLGR